MGGEVSRDSGAGLEVSMLTADFAVTLNQERGPNIL